ncbi:hypothetical protein GLP37_18425 [Photobacterium phosphoreum]|uniref:glycosyltransferase family 29 protein n=1 Tax=Photobacterium phosphoreum TaxID=659 RepID=UPI001E3A8336|nr:glycosyltransferase family 29 protein [Photobacterium phosphoreum]MCD9504152.1 hypothetical protein [Photobacterium phosphoreum]
MVVEGVYKKMLNNVFSLGKKKIPKKYKRKIKPMLKNSGIYYILNKGEDCKNLKENNVTIKIKNKNTLSQNEINSISMLAESDVILARRKIDALWINFAWNRLLVLKYCDLYVLENDYSNAIRLLDKAIGRDKHWMLYHRKGLLLRSSGKLNHEVLDNLLKSYNLSKSVKVLIDYVKSSWAINGVTPELIKYCDILYRKKNDLASVDFILLSSIDCDAGRITLAKRKALEALDKDKNVFDKYQSLPVLSLLYTLDNDKYLYCKYAFDVINHIKNNSDILIDNLINAKSFAIVGNGPSELESCNGDLIDSKDFVLRFNAYNTDYPLSIDYGSKTDAWMRAGNYIDLPRRSLNKLSFTIISGYNNIYRSTMGFDDYYDSFISNHPVTIIPNYIYEELIFKLNAMPSAGLAVLYYIYKNIGKIPKDSVFGFSYGNQPKNSSHHYFYNSKSKNHYNHDWNAEAIILAEIIE